MADEPTGWATVQDVALYAGAQSITPEHLARAAATIDVASGRPFSAAVAAKVSANDAYWLKLAVCYQAVWLVSQIDMFDRMDITQTDGGAANAILADTALTLAPLAKQALNRVSWRKTRSVRVRSPFLDGGSRVDPLNEAADEGQRWRPMGGA